MPIKFLQPTHRQQYGDMEDESGYKKPKSFKKILKWLVYLVILGVVCGVGVIIYVSRDLPDPNKLNDRQVTQSTKIYDRTGEHLLYEVFQNQKRTLVDLNQMSQYVPKATIAIEDKKFYEHSGVRWISIVRAAFNNLIGRKAGSGGASTLTQQFIKKTMVGDEHSIFRKVKEAILAMQLEKKYNKEDILKMYLNEIPYGSTNYGVEAASQSYFHKSAKDVKLEEAATLAALIQAPSRYLNDVNSLRDRRDLVLRLMNEQGFITTEEKTKAQGEAMRIYRNNGIMEAPHFVMYVKQLLADQFGEKQVDDGGLKVITTIDYDKQVAAQKIVKDNGDKFAKESNANNAALVAIDPKTAQILALVGSRDFGNDEIDGQFNVAILGKRQPGSSFKPFVYTAAFEKGYTPDTVLYDVKTNFDKRANGNYTPENYDGTEHGLVTMRKALQGSLNIPAVKTLYLVGTKEAIDFAKKFGYTTFTGDPGLSLVLGGAEVNLLEHTNAYATLSDNGIYHVPVSILKVTDAQNNTLFEWKPMDGTEAIKPELAATIASVLTDDAARAFMFGRGSTLTLPGRPVAAKTGTTNNYKDAWTMGYTPSIATGVWVGNTIPSPMKGGGNKLAGLIWNQFMREATKDTPVEQFLAPPPNDALKPVLRGSDGGIKVKVNMMNGKIATSSTPPNLITEKIFLPPHDILNYVSKDDPRGPFPSNPNDDPQYENWEAALQDWITRMDASGKNLSLEEPPTLYDDGSYNSELTPTIEILSPLNNYSTTSRQLEIKVKAGSPRGIKQVTYELDGETIGTAPNFPFDFSYFIPKLYTEQHILKAYASDDQGNTGATQITFFVSADFDPPTFSWIDGASVIISKNEYPRKVEINPTRWDDIKDIKITLVDSKGKGKVIFTFNHTEDKLNDSNHLEFTWKNAPAIGKYTLKALLTSKKGETEEKDLAVEVTQ